MGTLLPHGVPRAGDGCREDLDGFDEGGRGGMASNEKPDILGERWSPLHSRHPSGTSQVIFREVRYGLFQLGEG
jgi:hypothetical protein